MPRRVLVVGAGLAGARCAQTLRALGFDGGLTVVGAEPHAPYERPALSKQFLAGTRDEIALRPPDAWSGEGIRLLLGTTVQAVDPARRRARTSAGDLRWDALVLATGARARRLPALAGPGVHVLRTLADAGALRAALAAGRRLAVVGAGLVGTEVASTASGLGLDVTLVDGGRAPLERALGHEVGVILADRYRAHGVALRLGEAVAGVRRGADGLPRALVLSDGGEVACDAVLVAVGAEPAGELLGSRGRIETDCAGRTAAEGVFACGDTAAPWSPALGRHVALEHWTSAADQATAVAHALLGLDPPAPSAPYFWTDQFGLRIQHVGSATEWARVVLDGDESSFAARYLARDGRLAAALVVNRPGDAGRLRRELAPHRLAA
jgi:3-phenylpropionate/trans-cinnamate dioxygenase ferredoxin reductase subunit